MLVLPPRFEQAKRYPLVIGTRCYSQDKFVIDGTYTTSVAARAMAGQGIIVLQAGEPLAADDPNILRGLPAAVAGYEAAIDRLARDGYIDPGRVGIIGFSRTTAKALHAITFAQHRFRAALIADGFYYGLLQYFVGIDNRHVNLVARQFDLVYGGPPFGPYLAEYVERNPMLNLGRNCWRG